MYYVQDYYTQELFDTFADLIKAIELSKKTIDSEVVDENGNYFYCNIDLPF